MIKERRMNRKILFKAKLKKTDGTLGDWIEGGYCAKHVTTYFFETDKPNQLHHYIARDEMTDWNMPNVIRLHEVDPPTVCQYTGFKDKAGVRIFEGDVLKVSITDDFEPCEFKEVVFWDEKQCGYYIREQGSPDPFPLGDCDLENSVVIGNIFDNPELMA